MTLHNKYLDDHPYMKRLDEVLKDFFVCKVSDANGAEHGEDYEEMKQVILDALFHHHKQQANTLLDGSATHRIMTLAEIREK